MDALFFLKLKRMYLAYKSFVSSRKSIVLVYIGECLLYEQHDLFAYVSSRYLSRKVRFCCMAELAFYSARLDKVLL